MNPRSAPSPPTLLTIGHSTRELTTFIELLQSHGVTCVVDVRTIPRSRHNPQFNQETLPDSLKTAGIRYRHMPGLGGLRRPRADSPNAGWRNASFRGFADYMQTPEFADHLSALVDLARQERVALMCAETVPWRCHRSLIADALLVRRIRVAHILSRTRCETHAITPWARVRGGRLTYPAQTRDARNRATSRGTGRPPGGARELRHKKKGTLSNH